MPYAKLHYHFVVLSFGENNLAAIVRHILNQNELHADGALIAAMERMDDR